MFPGEGGESEPVVLAQATTGPARARTPTDRGVRATLK